MFWIREYLRLNWLVNIVLNFAILSNQILNQLHNFFSSIFEPLILHQRFSVFKSNLTTLGYLIDLPVVSHDFKNIQEELWVFCHIVFLDPIIIETVFRVHYLFLVVFNQINYQCFFLSWTRSCLHQVSKSFNRCYHSFLLDVNFFWKRFSNNE